MIMSHVDMVVVDDQLGRQMIMRKKDPLVKIGTTRGQCVNRILLAWQAATASDIERGARWYGEALTIAQGLAQRAGVPVESAAAVISHLSPQTRWARNVEQATALLLTGDTSGTGALQESVKRANRSLQSSDPVNTFSRKAKKTGRFVRNILGDHEAVTIDVWALQVAIGERDDSVNVIRRAGVYESLESAYRTAARVAGVDPSTMQATTWIVARNGRSS